MIEMFVAGGAILFIDQWSKRFVRLHTGGGCFSVGPMLQIRCVANQGNFYQRRGTRAAFVTVWLAALLAAIILHHSGAWFQGRIGLIGLGLALGGAAGNLWDILRRGYVLDFIDLRYWPVFNLADAAIVTGLPLAFW